MNKIAIFKTGKHQPLRGDVLTVTPEMLREVVSSYNAEAHEAPAVVGHPKLDAPAYGWVKSLSFSDTDGVLYADFAQVEPQFEQLLKDGRFKKRSASFFSPQHPGNPTQGKWYLRHVGFLGAKPPSVKGLKDFADDASCPVYEFTQHFAECGAGFSDLPINSNEEIMPKENEIPNAKPSRHVGTGRDLSLHDDTQTADFADHTTRDANGLASREAQIAADEKALAAREAKVKADEAALAKKQEDARKKHFAEFADTLIECGKVLPAEKDAIVSAFIDVDNGDKSFDFAEGDEVKSKTGVDVLQSVLQRLPATVDFSERAGRDPNSAGKPRHGDSEADKDDKLHQAIADFAEKEGIGFAEAAAHFDDTAFSI